MNEKKYEAIAMLKEQIAQTVEALERGNDAELLGAVLLLKQAAFDVGYRIQKEYER